MNNLHERQGRVRWLENSAIYVCVSGSPCAGFDQDSRGPVLERLDLHELPL